MKRTIQRTLAVATSVVMLSTLAACGGDDASENAQALDENSTGELTLSYWDKNQTPTVEAGIAAFNEKYPNIKVTPSLTAYKDYFTKLRTQAEGDQLPDVFWMNGPNITLYAANDQLAALDDIADVDWSNYPEALVDIYTHEDTHYGVPKDFDTIACIINKDIFEAAGIDVPTGDWTWEEFSEIANTISDTQDGVYGVVGDVIGGGQESYYNTIAQAGGFVIEDGKSGYDNADTKRGLQFWADLIKDGGMAPIEVINDTKSEELFVSGKAAMYWAGSWEPGVLKEKMGEDANLTVVPLPEDKQKGSIIHGLAYVAAAESANLPAAKALIQVMTSEEIAKVEAENGTAIPAFNNTQETWTQLAPDWNLQVYIDAADNYSIPYPVSANTAAWNEKENELLVPAFQGKVSVDQAAEDLATAMNELLSAE